MEVSGVVLVVCVCVGVGGVCSLSVCVCVCDLLIFLPDRRKIGVCGSQPHHTIGSDNIV